jgi:hypothetical protein
VNVPRHFSIDDIDLGKYTIKFVQQDSSKVLMVKVAHVVPVGSEQQSRVGLNLDRDVSPVFDPVGKSKVINKLYAPGKFLNSGFVEFVFSKPGRKQSTNSTRFDDYAFDPIEPASSKFKVNR